MKFTFVGNFDVDFSSETHHKKTLESLGHEVITLREGKASVKEIFEHAIWSDGLIWVHTHGWVTPQTGDMSLTELFQVLKRAGVPTFTYHLDLWKGLKREQDLENDPFYKTIGHFFTVDKLMADWFNENTDVKGHYIHAGVFDQETNLLEGMSKDKDVIFVGSKGYHPEWQYRPQLINWLQDTYRNRFTHIGGDGQIPTTRGKALNELYASSKIAVGDSLCINFDYPYYWSDRVYETLGRGGFMIHPYIKGMEEDFEDGKHLIFYTFGDFNDLKNKIDYYLEHDDERETIRKFGHAHVRNNHTYKNRWQQIIGDIYG